MRKRFSYANVMSTVALFVALGGTSYAAVQLDGASIQHRSIPGAKIKRNALRGSEIRESSLGRVPRAATADRVNGLTEYDLQVKCPPDTEPVGGTCIETVVRPAETFFRALQTCDAQDWPSEVGARLPTYGELRMAVSVMRLADNGELTGDVVPSSTSPGQFEVLSYGYFTPEFQTTGQAMPFRCAMEPFN